ncbi:hypothetical protein GCM10020369_69750 [Cryptosporangium minutisporangium]|uniref:pectate lyase n=1 Tax=Cryptosporangium minutisporangium TaxID=113569 RepID=A0ABP6TAI6_9ACTN
MAQHGKRSARRWIVGTAAVGALLAGSVAVGVSASADASFRDDFEDGKADGWSKSGGTWSVVSDDSQVLRQTNAGSEHARHFAGDSGWTDYTLRARTKPTSYGTDGAVSVVARATSATTFVRLALLPGNRAQLQAVNSGTVRVLATTSVPTGTGAWYSVTLQVSGDRTTATVDGTTVGTVSGGLPARGRIGVSTSRATAAFDDVTVTAGGTVQQPAPSTPAPTTATPSTSASASPTAIGTATATTAPSPTKTTTPAPSGTTTAAWPTATGSVQVPETIEVSGTLDGGLKRYSGIGDGGQSESQDAMFELADGATLRNVIIGAPAGDGVHCTGSCTLINVWWEDVGEDAATFKGGTNAAYTVDGGGARSASDKVFQHNGGGTLTIRNFQVENAGKLYRSCGNCATSYERHVVLDRVTVTNTKTVAGVNANFGDTATLTNITVVGDAKKATKICTRFQGTTPGNEPTQLGSGPDGTTCLYRESDITWR